MKIIENKPVVSYEARQLVIVLHEAYTVRKQALPGSSPPRKISIIKGVRNVTGLGLRDAKDLVEHVLEDKSLEGTPLLREVQTGA